MNGMVQHKDVITDRINAIPFVVLDILQNTLKAKNDTCLRLQDDGAATVVVI
jgi:hypothetical protein